LKNGEKENWRINVMKLEGDSEWNLKQKERTKDERDKNSIEWWLKSIPNEDRKSKRTIMKIQSEEYWKWIRREDISECYKNSKWLGIGIQRKDEKNQIKSNQMVNGI